MRMRVSFSSFCRSTERRRFNSHSATIWLKPTASCPISPSPRGTTRALSSPSCTRFIAAVISRTGRVTCLLSTSAPHRHSIRLTAPSVTPTSTIRCVISRLNTRGWLSSSVNPLIGSVCVV